MLIYSRYNLYITYKVDPHPVTVTIRDEKDYIRLLFYSYNTTTKGGGSTYYATPTIPL